jgi:hypothetical protein
VFLIEDDVDLDTLPVFLFEEDVDPDTLPMFLLEVELVLALSFTVEFDRDALPALRLADGFSTLRSVTTEDDLR